MREYIKEKIVISAEAIVLLAVLIPIYVYVIQPVLVALTPMAADSSLSTLALFATVVVGFTVYAVLKDPASWYRIITALFFGADYTDDEN